MDHERLSHNLNRLLGRAIKPPFLRARGQCYLPRFDAPLCVGGIPAGDSLQLLAPTVRFAVGDQGLPDELADLAPGFP
jgi:hypothetical protein